jgi:hypothetical protein
VPQLEFLLDIKTVSQYIFTPFAFLISKLSFVFLIHLYFVRQDISQVEQRWLKENDLERNVNGDSAAPMSDSDNIDIEKYQKSISECVKLFFASEKFFPKIR